MLGKLDLKRPNYFCHYISLFAFLNTHLFSSLNFCIYLVFWKLCSRLFRIYFFAPFILYLFIFIFIFAHLFYSLYMYVVFVFRVALFAHSQRFRFSFHLFTFLILMKQVSPGQTLRLQSFKNFCRPIFTKTKNHLFI